MAIQRTPGNYKQTVYSDFRTDFECHPITGDLVLVTNEDSIIQALKVLMETSTYEVPWNSKFAGNIKGLLFELPTAITVDAIQTNISLTIKNYEPRVNLISVDVNFQPDNNLYGITITFSVNNITNPVQFTHLLKRDR